MEKFWAVLLRLADRRMFLMKIVSQCHEQVKRGIMVPFSRAKRKFQYKPAS